MMRPDHDPDELERLIAARRDGEPVFSGDPLTDALADLADDLDALAIPAAEPDPDAAWHRIAAQIETYEEQRARPSVERWWKRPLPVRRVWGPALAASLMLIAIVVALVSEPTNTAEAFVRDVEQLSSVASGALADDVLTTDERRAVATLTAALVDTLDRRPDVLASLAPSDRASVLTILDEVVSALTPAADAELAERRTAGLLAAAGLDSEASVGQPAADPGEQPRVAPRAGAEPARAATAAPTVLAATPPVQRTTVAATPTTLPASATPATPATPTAPDTSVASAVTALEGVTDAVQGARPGQAAPVAPDSGGAAADRDDPSLCAGLTGAARASCETAVNAAIAACGTATDGAGLEACERASTVADARCEELLSKRDAKACGQALERLTRAARQQLKRSDGAHNSAPGYENIAPSGKGRGDRDRGQSDEDSDDD